jgi:hypothetical protein
VCKYAMKRGKKEAGARRGERGKKEEEKSEEEKEKYETSQISSDAQTFNLSRFLLLFSLSLTHAHIHAHKPLPTARPSTIRGGGHAP